MKFSSDCMLYLFRVSDSSVGEWRTQVRENVSRYERVCPPAPNELRSCAPGLAKNQGLKAGCVVLAPSLRQQDTPSISAGTAKDASKERSGGKRPSSAWSARRTSAKAQRRRTPVRIAPDAAREVAEFSNRRWVGGNRRKPVTWLRDVR